MRNDEYKMALQPGAGSIRKKRDGERFDSRGYRRQSIIRLYRFPADMEVYYVNTRT